jgi:hypothetical protein
LFVFLSAAAIALLAEAAIIIPVFRLVYHAYLLIFSAMVALMVPQLLAEALSAQAEKRIGTKSHAPATD